MISKKYSKLSLLLATCTMFSVLTLRTNAQSDSAKLACFDTLNLNQTQKNNLAQIKQNTSLTEAQKQAAMKQFVSDNFSMSEKMKLRSCIQSAK